MTSLRRLVCPFNALPLGVTVFLWNCGRHAAKAWSIARRGAKYPKVGARIWRGATHFSDYAAVPSHTHHAAVRLWLAPASVVHAAVGATAPPAQRALIRCPQRQRHNRPPPRPSTACPRNSGAGRSAAIFTALALASLDTAIANVALPAIAADLHVSPADVVWVVNIYQIALVATLLPLGALGEIVGHQRIYLGGLLLFTLASLGCALAWSLPSLTAARLLQGLGASGIMSVNAALVRFVYPTHMLGRGFGHNALVVGTAFTLGPTIASAILADRNMAVAVRDQHSLRRDRNLDRPEDLAENAARKARVRFYERGADRQLPRSLHCSASAARRIRRLRRWSDWSLALPCCSAGS